MDEITHAVRREEWIKIIQACNSSGQKKKVWCAENGIPARRYFYWQKKLRAELYKYGQGEANRSLAASAGSEASTTFAEVSMESPEPMGFRADAVIRAGGLCIEIRNTACPELMEQLGRMLRNVV